jgi:hypothetical protein
MKQSFQCSNLECNHKTKDYGHMRIKDLYKEIEKEGVQIEEDGDKDLILCSECGHEMVYVSIG